VAVERGDQSPQQLPGRLSYLMVSDVLVLVGRLDEARRVANNGAHDLVVGTPFWDRFSRAYVAFLNHEELLDEEIPAKGQEKYWVPYFDYMKDVAFGRDPSGAREVVRTFFDRRNRDKTFARSDAELTEGNGTRPALWDYRLASLDAISRAIWGTN
jgi:hypothetical protein